MIVIDADKLLKKIKLSVQVNPHDGELRDNHIKEHEHFLNMIEAMPHDEASKYVSVNELWILLNRCHADGSINDMTVLAEKIGKLKRLSEVL